MPFLQQGNSAAVTVPAGQSIRIGAFRAASASITMDLGLPGGPSQTVYDIASTFGPYVVGASVSVSATHGVIEYVVGVAPVLTDEMLVSGSVDPLTGGISLQGPDGNQYATGGITPTVLTSAGIATAAGIAAAMGGGKVILPPQSIPMTASLPLYPGVTYAGSGWKLGKVGSETYALVGGTILQGDGTFPAFYQVATADGSSGIDTLGDLTAPPLENAVWTDSMGFNTGAVDLAIDGFSYGIKSGAKYNGGVYAGHFRNLMAQHCTQWGFWFENMLNTKYEQIYAYYNANGAAFVASGNANMLFGDSHAYELHPYGNTKRGLVMAARGGSAMNDMHWTGVHAIGPLPPVNYTASLTGASSFTAQMSATSSVTPNACTGYIDNGAGAIGVYMVITSGANIYPGMTIGGSGVTAATMVLSQISGTPHGAGTYQVTVGQLVASSGSPQTINVGSVLSGSGYAIDMALSTLSSTPGLSGTPAYILAGSGSTWYVNSVSTVGSSTIYGSTPAISVPDLSKFSIGQPVCFTTTSNPNNFTTKASYFVRTMSAASGAGTITLCLNNWSQAQIADAGAASFCAGHGSTGTTTATIATTGFPVVEIANWEYGSTIASSSLCGTSDIESGGTTRMLIQGVSQGSGSWEIGTVAANFNTYTSVSVRNCANLQILNRYHNLILDSDVTNIGLTGMAPTTIIGGNNCGVGFQQVPSTNAGALYLSGYQLPEIAYLNGFTTFQGKSIALTPVRLTSGTIGTSQNNLTMTLASPQTYTLPAVSATNVGWELRLNNPTGNTATLNTSSSQNIVGLGASVTSISMTTLTSAYLIASYDGTNYYWARIA